MSWAENSEGDVSRDQRHRRLVGSITLVLLMLAGISTAHITFERTYGDSLEDNGRSCWQTLDGGYIIAGSARSFSAGSLDVYLVRTDSLGDTLWTRACRDSANDEGNRVRPASDGGYVVTGQTRPYGPAPIDWDVYLLKLDSLGLRVWDKAYDPWGGHDRGYCVQQTLDRGYIVVGNTDVPNVSSNVYLVKTDANGNLVWEEVYGGPGQDGGWWVEQTQDSGYIITGHIYLDSPLGWNVYLVKTDKYGFRKWERTYGDSGTNIGYCVQETMDNGYIIVGASRPVSSANSDAYLIKTDFLGNTLWERKYGGAGWDDGYCVLQTPDGGYVILGATESFGAGSGDLWFFKMDSLGNVLWSRTYGGTATDAGSEVRQTSDGGFILAGLTRSFGEGQGDVYLVKTDENGLVGAAKDAAVLSLGSPPDTVFSDSTYVVTATVENLGNLTVTFDVVAEIDGYADTVQVQNLDPGASTQVGFQGWQVPSADSTLYVMTVCVHAEDDVDSSNDCKQKTIFAYNPTGIEELSEHRGVPLDFHLWPNEPNPFYTSTGIRYSLGTSCGVTLTVYDVAGRPVTTLVSEEQGPGVHSVTWDGGAHSSGVYFYRLQAGSFADTRKMVLAR